MNGVTAALIAVTSPLGKLWYLMPLKNSLGLSVCEGRLRWKVTFSAAAPTAEKATASIERQKVSPSLFWSPSANEPPRIVAIMAYCRSFCVLRFQMPWLS